MVVASPLPLSPLSDSESPKEDYFLRSRACSAYQEQESLYVHPREGDLTAWICKQKIMSVIQALTMYSNRANAALEPHVLVKRVSMCTAELPRFIFPWFYPDKLS